MDALKMVSARYINTTVTTCRWLVLDLDIHNFKGYFLLVEARPRLTALG
jgi:hypothetical protein